VPRTSIPKAIARRISWLRSPAPLNDFADYDAYWEARGNMPTVQHRWKVAAEAIPNGATVLDVGCGSGQFLEYLRGERPLIEGTGCDVSDVAAEKTRARGFQAYVRDLGSEDLEGRFDFVTCFEVVEHIPNAEVAFQRLLQVAEKQVILSVPNLGFIDYRLRLALFGRFPVTNIQFHMKEHVRHWTPTDFEEWVQHYGGRIVGVFPQYLQHGNRWGLVERFPKLLSAGLVYVIEPASR
jgi:methionine biosynthesis protein MetW